MKFINIHTHHPTREKDCIEVVNYFPEDDIVDNDLLGSVGLHPWHIETSDFEGKLEAIKKHLTLENIIAIGEIGLDRASKIDFDLQVNVFKKQLQLASDFNMPIIIHCVRAFPDLIKIKKQFQNKLPWIIHGFNENHQIAKELLKYDCYLSVGNSILSEKSKIKNYFSDLPLHKIFLETDDESDIDIEDIYIKTSYLSNVPMESLQQQIFSNFRKVFPNRL